MHIVNVYKWDIMHICIVISAVKLMSCINNHPAHLKFLANGGIFMLESTLYIIYMYFLMLESTLYIYMYFLMFELHYFHKMFLNLLPSGWADQSIPVHACTVCPV